MHNIKLTFARSYLNKCMENKWHIWSFLFVISIIMVTITAIPHHHHSDGMICMKDDIQETACPCSPESQHHHDDPCCTNECMASFNSPVPTAQNQEVQPHYLYAITLFTEPLLRLLTQPEEHIIRHYSVYIESLHGTFITRAAGLRAPPYFLS